MGALLSDADVGLASAPQAAAPALLSDADVGIGGVTPNPGGVLSNSPDDGFASGTLKGIGTAAIKGLANIPGFAGNLGNLADYLVARGHSALSGRPVEDVLSEMRGIDQQVKDARSQTVLGRMVNATDPRRLSGENIAAPVLRATGEYVPESMPGRMAQAGVETAIGMLGPGGGARVTPTSLGGYLGEAARMAPGMATAGAIGEGTTEWTGDPLIGLAAGLAVPAATSAATAGARRLTRGLSQTGREQMVGERLIKESSDPSKVAADIQFQPADIVPGSTPTTGQLTGDMGLLQAERRLRTEDNTAFNDRETDQNSARRSMLETQSPQDADSLLPSRMFQRHLDTIDKATQDAVDRLTTGARAITSDALANGVTPDAPPELMGERLRTAVQAAKDAAREHRKALYDAVDPNNDLFIVAAPVRARGSQIERTIDPYAAPLSADETRIMAQISQLPDVLPFNSLRELDSNITDAMSRERRAAGESKSWGRLSQLKGSVIGAINDAIDHQAAYEHANGLRGAPDSLESRLSDYVGRNSEPSARAGLSRPSEGYSEPPAPETLTDASFHRTASEERRPAELGESSPGVSGRFNERPGLSQYSRPPQNLLSWLRSKGGIRDDGGELMARDLRTSYPGLVNNKSGMNLDAAREAAAEAGYLGADRSHAMSNTTVSDLLNAVDDHPRYSSFDRDHLERMPDYTAWKDSKSEHRASIAEIADRLAETGAHPETPENLHDAARIMVSEGLPWDDALERVYLQKDQRDAIQRETSRRQGEGTAGTSGAGAGRGEAGSAGERGAWTGEPGADRQPNFGRADAARLQAAKVAHADYDQTFRKGPVGQVLKTTGFSGQYQIPDSKVLSRAFVPGDAGYQTTRSFLTAAKNEPNAVSAMADYAASKLASTVGPEGTVDPSALRGWKSRYGNALRAVDEQRPGFSAQFDNAGRATEILERAGAARKSALDDFQKSEAANFLGKTSPTEVENQIGSIIKDGKNGPTRMRELVASARGNPDVMDGLRKAAVDWIARHVSTASDAGTSGEPLLSNANLTKLLRNNQDALSAILPKESMNALRLIEADMARSEMSTTATRVKDSPGSAKDSGPLLKKAAEHAKHTSLPQAVMAGAGAAFLHDHNLMHAIYGGVAGGALYGIGTIRRAGLDKVDAMFRDALLNPERARYYLAKVPAGRNDHPALRNLVRMVRRGIITAPVNLEADRRKAYAQ